MHIATVASNYSDYVYIFIFFFFLYPYIFPVSGHAVVAGVVPSPPRFLAFNFYRANISATPLLVHLSSSVVTNSRCRTFRKSICAQQKVPTIFYQYALRGFQHTKLTYIPGSKIARYDTGSTGYNNQPPVQNFGTYAHY